MLVCVCVWQRSNTCRNQVATSLSLAPVQDERWEGNLPPTHGRSALAAVWQARDSDAGKNLSNTYVTLAVRSWKLETNLHSTRCTRWQLSCRWQKAMWTPLRLCSNCFFLFFILCDLPSIYGNDDDAMVIILGYTKHFVVLGLNACSGYFCFITIKCDDVLQCDWINCWIHVWENLLHLGEMYKQNEYFC